MSLCPPTIELESGPVTAVDLALFAAASGDHNPLHLDADVAQAAGFDRPLVHGMLSMALAGRLLTVHFGAGSVRALQVRFTGVAKCGQKILIRGSLARMEDGVAHYDLVGRVNDVEILAGRSTVKFKA